MEVFLISRRRTIEPSSKEPLQKFSKVQYVNECFELIEPLPQKALDILGVLGADGVASEAARALGQMITEVARYLFKSICSNDLYKSEDEDHAH